mgnify:CR=1 FL=1
MNNYNKLQKYLENSFSTMPLHSTGQDHFLKPLLGYAGQKLQVLLKKEFAYLLSRCYNFHKDVFSCFFFSPPLLEALLDDGFFFTAIQQIVL